VIPSELSMDLMESPSASSSSIQEMYRFDREYDDEYGDDMDEDSLFQSPSFMEGGIPCVSLDDDDDGDDGDDEDDYLYNTAPAGKYGGPHRPSPFHTRRTSTTGSSGASSGFSSSTFLSSGDEGHLIRSLCIASSMDDDTDNINIGSTKHPPQQQRTSSAGSSSTEWSSSSSTGDEGHNIRQNMLDGDEFGSTTSSSGLMPAVSTEESDLSTGTLSMLGLFSQSGGSVVSFDSTFMEEEEEGGSRSRSLSHSRSRCSVVSMHDITTIHEENEDDIAEEEEELEEVLLADPDHAVPACPLIGGSLQLLRRDLVRQGTAGTFSSVTDDSYLACMSLDSLSGCGFDNSSVCSYDSFSSESVMYMVDVLKEETERRRSKIKERIAMIQESIDLSTKSESDSDTPELVDEFGNEEMEDHPLTVVPPLHSAGSED